FALGDLVVTDHRKRHVAFTDPFLSTELAAIIHKNDSQNLATLEDLAHLNEVRSRSKVAPIGYLTLANTSIQKMLSKSSDLVAIQLNEWIQNNPDKAFAHSNFEAIERVKNGRVA